jgi:two-component system, LytTR family, sensor kinase
MILNRKINRHLLFWAGLFVYNWLVYGALNDAYEGFFYWSILNTCIMAIATYFAINILIEQYFLTGRKKEFYFLLVFSLAGFAILRRVLNYYLIFKHFFIEKCKMAIFYAPKILAEGFGIAMIAAMGIMFHFINKWAEERASNQHLLNEKLAAQMELLKSQVQPHFIFNTLNNIYSLSFSNSTLASEMIYRLSGLLSYMLYDSKKEMIPLEKEIEYINHFIKLQQLRFGNRLDVSLNVYSGLNGVELPPLLVLPFVENCFKHGIDNNLEKSWITIDFSSVQKELKIKIENSIAPSCQNIKRDEEKSGIGIANVKNRLDIIYPNQHTLKILPSENAYLVVLKIPLLKSNQVKHKFITDKVELS